MPATPSLKDKVARTVEYHRLRLKFMAARLFGYEYVPVRGRITLEPSGNCNLSCKFCGYSKKEFGRTVMPQAAFEAAVEQAVAMGYGEISLTSSSGDLFMDKGIRKKLEFLEGHPGINAYVFFTNFVLPDADMVHWLASLKKLRWMALSVYGHDLETFSAITGKREKQYRMLVDNINTLAALARASVTQFEIQIRTSASFDWHPDKGIADDDSDLMKAMYRAVADGGMKWVGNWTVYDTWGGMVTPKDVAGLDIELSDGQWLPKVGACTLLFDDPMVFADGMVNACACRGLDRSLVIGDVNKTPLADILSPDNPAYRSIIERHQRGDYPDTCKNCMTYRSIYRRPRGWPYISLKEFFTRRHRGASA